MPNDLPPLTDKEIAEILDRCVSGITWIEVRRLCRDLERMREALRYIAEDAEPHIIAQVARVALGESQ